MHNCSSLPLTFPTESSLRVNKPPRKPQHSHSWSTGRQGTQSCCFHIWRGNFWRISSGRQLKLLSPCGPYKTSWFFVKVFSRVNVLDHVIFHLKWRTASFSLPSSLIHIECRHQCLHTSLADQVILSPHFCAKQKSPVLPLMISYQTVQSLICSNLPKSLRILGTIFCVPPLPETLPWVAVCYFTSIQISAKAPALS